MNEPSEYELAAWEQMQQFRGRPLSQGSMWISQKAADGIARLNEKSDEFLETHPGTEMVLSRGKEVAERGASAVSWGWRKASDNVPDWGVHAVEATRRTVGRISRAGLSPKRVVARHQKRGHDVTRLSDIRKLDLEQIDEVMGRGASWYFPALGAISGAGSGLVITGGDLVMAVSAGAAAAPSGGAVLGALASDTALVLVLSSRAIGQVALNYGYDPEDPAEKVFIMSVINVGSAMSATAKTAAMADLSRLTQSLVRGKPWKVLNSSVVAKVSQQTAKVYGTRLTKRGLGKVVPAVGIVVGGTMNWTTLESIVDTAQVAYRRRVLIEKYPHLSASDSSVWLSDIEGEVADDADEVLSVIDELADAGGPDLRDPAALADD
ncbi:EcsC family protein [Propionibacteriaceae bacterium G1746]